MSRNELYTWLSSHKLFCCQNYCWKVRQNQVRSFANFW